ncbi:MAG: hypothetical protein HOV79_21340 [Hamadaea sp.]|nr:hypothetical protein [Hamadaea sp.]
MSDTAQPDLPSPEDEGIPGYADDTSTAYDRGDRPHFDDTAPALPEDEPLELPTEEPSDDELADEAAMEDVGTGEEFGDSDVGEPLDAAVDEPAQDVYLEDLSAADTEEALKDRELTAYDLEEPGTAVGRLEAPDSGAGIDDEATSVATDTGEVEGMSAEEAAMHTVDPAEIPYDS